MGEPRLNSADSIVSSARQLEVVSYHPAAETERRALKPAAEVVGCKSGIRRVHAPLKESWEEDIARDLSYPHTRNSANRADRRITIAPVAKTRRSANTLRIGELPKRNCSARNGTSTSAPPTF